MKPWRAVEAQNGGVEAQNGARGVSRPVHADSHHLDEEQDPDSKKKKKYLFSILYCSIHTARLSFI
jgi:hypothetical protein